MRVKHFVNDKVIFFITCSRDPPLIIRFVNFNNGNSNVFAYKDLLFLKHIGMSIKLVEKKDVIVDCRKNKKVEKICGVWIYIEFSSKVFCTNVLSAKYRLFTKCKDIGSV